MDSEFVMLVVSVPKDRADAVRKAMGDAGGGRLGNYSHCSFSYEGEGRFVPGEAAHPSVGVKGEINCVPEVRIEMLCTRAVVKNVIAEMRKAHPYEEPAFHYVGVEIQ